MKKETLVWQVIVLILGLFLIVTVREYLLDKNEIEAERAHVECVLEAKKMGAETLYDNCQDIKLYKVKLNKL